MMDATQIHYPILCITKDMVFVRSSSEEFTTTNKLYIGSFENMLLVEASGKTYTVREARKANRVGHFWQFEHFPSYRVKVEPILQHKQEISSLDQVKSLVAKAFKWKGWSEGEGGREMQMAVRAAKSIAEIIEIFREDIVLTEGMFKFPLICISSHAVWAAHAKSDLTIVRESKLARMLYDLLIIDADGNSVKVKAFRKLHGVGFLGGYAFFDRKLEIELIIDSLTKKKMTFEEGKSFVLKAQKKRTAINGADLGSIRKPIEDARTYTEIAMLISGA